MRRTYLCLAALALSPLVALCVWRASSGQAPAQPAEKDATQPPPLTQVVLFNTGVGYFQREGTVEGDARVELSFPVADINDLLKTLSIDDGGRPAGVSLDSSEPLGETLANFSVDLAANPTFGELLNQLRGEKVEVSVEGGPGVASTTLSGTVVGMEGHFEGQPQAEVHHLNLLTADGARRLPLARVTRVRLLDPRLDDDFRRALAALAGGRGSQRRRVTAHLSGAGKRTVKIAHVAEAPIWKASYRLDLEAKGNKARLLTNAVVENTSESDWKEVRLVLVSGRPVTFQMDLARSLYVPRPTVEPRYYASLRPPEHATMPRGGQLGGLGVGGMQLGALGGAFGMTGQPINPLDDEKAGRHPALALPPTYNRYQMPTFRDLGPRRLTYQELVARRDQELKARAQERVGALAHGSLIARQEGLEALAVDADRIGEAFKYTLDRKVTVPRQKSALLPVLDAGVEATRLSVYNRSVHPFFPMSSLKVKNTTGQHLQQGPVAVREEGLYAGDARLPDLQPGQEKLVSYAMDLGLEVRPEVSPIATESEMISIAKGAITFRQKARRTTTYRLTNRSKLDRTAVVEHPRGGGWVVQGPEKPAAQGEQLHRFEWPVEAGKSVAKEVVEVNITTTVAELDQPEKRLREMLGDAGTPARFKPALQKVLDLRRRHAAVHKEAKQAAALVAKLEREQARLRSNLKELPKDSAAYKRIVEAFDMVEQQYTKAAAAAETKSEAALKVMEELQAHLETAEVK